MKIKSGPDTIEFTRFTDGSLYIEMETEMGLMANIILTKKEANKLLEELQKMLAD